MKQSHHCIMGAGLQGALLALKLAERGADVTLIERADAPLTGASRFNEGKVHLGYIFVKDDVRRTARRMIEGAVSFLDELSPFLPQRDIEQNLSDPLLYKVPADSLMPPEALAAQYDAMDDMISDALMQGTANYLGQRRLPRVRRLPDPDRETGLIAEFQTAEQAIDPDFLCDHLTAALLHPPRIELVTQTTVMALHRQDNRPPNVVTAQHGLLGPFDSVTNCTWDSLLHLDGTLGHRPRLPHLHRLKLANTVTLPSDIPAPETVTLVLGPYGDVVRYRSNRVFYSWYPTGCIDRSEALAPPQSWRDMAPERNRQLALDALAQLDPFVGGLAPLRASDLPARSNARVIFSWGTGDVDQPDSLLHERFRIGPRLLEPGYLSIDTGKLTTAPLFAAQALEMLVA